MTALYVFSSTKPLTRPQGDGSGLLWTPGHAVPSPRDRSEEGDLHMAVGLPDISLASDDWQQMLQAWARMARTRRMTVSLMWHNVDPTDAAHDQSSATSTWTTTPDGVEQPITAHLRLYGKEYFELHNGWTGVMADLKLLSTHPDIDGIMSHRITCSDTSVPYSRVVHVTRNAKGAIDYSTVRHISYRIPLR